jgi:hypothetical protein
MIFLFPSLKKIFLWDWALNSHDFFISQLFTSDLCTFYNVSCLRLGIAFLLSLCLFVASNDSLVHGQVHYVLMFILLGKKITSSYILSWARIRASYGGKRWFGRVSYYPWQYLCYKVRKIDLWDLTFLLYSQLPPPLGTQLIQYSFYLICDKLSTLFILK